MEWIDNADSYICSVCKTEINNPAKYGYKCPVCNCISDNDKKKLKSSEMNAVEVLEWLAKHETKLDEIFGFQISKWTYNLPYLFHNYETKEIVDCIEKYEAEKKKKDIFDKAISLTDEEKEAHEYVMGILSGEQQKQEFKVGDWVRSIKTNKLYLITDDDGDGVRYSGKENGVKPKVLIVSKYLKHAEPPKEEKNKAPHIDASYEIHDIIRIVNRLIDEVNELRGAEYNDSGV